MHCLGHYGLAVGEQIADNLHAYKTYLERSECFLGLMEFDVGVESVG